MADDVAKLTVVNNKLKQLVKQERGKYAGLEAKYNKLKYAYIALRDKPAAAASPAPASPAKPASPAPASPAKTNEEDQQLITNLKKMLKRTIKELDETKANLEKVRGGGSGDVDVTKDLRDEIAAKTEALASSQKMLRNLKAKYDTLKEKAGDEDLVATYQRQIAGLEQELEVMRDNAGEGAAAKQLAKARKELQETKTSLSAEQSRNSSLSTMDNDVEMLNIDRDLAVAKADAMQLDLQMLREELHDLKQELEFFQKAEEMESTIDPDSEEAVKKGTSKYRAALKQNEKLKQALLVIRDIAISDRNEYSTIIKEMKGKSDMAEKLIEQDEKQQEEIQSLQDEKDDLAKKLEEHMPALEHLDNVQEKCRILSEEVSELRVVIEDLEGMQDLQDEIEIGYLEQIGDFKTDLSYKDQKIKELTETLSQKTEEIKDHERRLEKFGAVVSDLQAKIAALAPEGEEIGDILDDDARAELNMQVAAQAQAQKNIAERLSKEHLKMKAEEGAEHVDLLEAFLPESFFKRDQAPIECRQMLGRIKFKINMLMSVYAEYYNLSAGTLEGKPCSDEDLAMVAQLQSRLLNVKHVVAHFMEQVLHCDDQLYARLTSMSSEMESREGELDEFIHIIMAGELSNNTDMSPIDRLAIQLQKLLDHTLPDRRPIQQWRLLKEQFEVLLYTNEAVGVYVRELSKRIRKMFECEAVGEEGTPTAKDKTVEGVLRLVRECQSENAHISIQARKLIKRIQEKTLPSMPENTFDELGNCQSLLTKTVGTLRKVAESYKNKVLDSAEGVLLPQELKNMVEGAVRQADASADFSGMGFVHGELQTTAETIYSIVGAVVNGDYYGDESDLHENEGQAMWEVRASAMQTELLQVAVLKDELENVNAQRNEALRTLKITEQQLNEASTNISVMEQRIMKLQAKIKTVDDLHEQIDTLGNDNKKLAHQLKKGQQKAEDLQDELVAADERNAKLEEKLKKNKKRQPLINLQNALLGGGNAPATPSSPSSVPRSPTRASPRATNSHSNFRDESPGPPSPRSPSRAGDATVVSSLDMSTVEPHMFSDETNSLRAAMFYLREENALLKSKIALESLNRMPSLQVPGRKERRKKPKGVRKDEDSVHECKSKLHYLIKSSVSAMAFPKVVSLTSGVPTAQQWTHEKERIKHIQEEQDTLRRRVAALTAKLKPGGAAAGGVRHLSTAAVQDMVKPDPVFLGRVRVPTVKGAGVKTKVVLSPADYTRLHSVFAS